MRILFYKTLRKVYIIHRFLGRRRVKWQYAYLPPTIFFLRASSTSRGGLVALPWYRDSQLQRTFAPVIGSANVNDDNQKQKNNHLSIIS